MSLAIVHTRARLGVDAPAVTVEVHLSNGLPGLSIVGLPETAVKESKDRVRSGLISSQLEFSSCQIAIQRKFYRKYCFTLVRSLEEHLN